LYNYLFKRFKVTDGITKWIASNVKAASHGWRQKSLEENRDIYLFTIVMVSDSLRGTIKQKYRKEVRSALYSITDHVVPDTETDLNHAQPALLVQTLFSDDGSNCFEDFIRDTHWTYTTRHESFGMRHEDAYHMLERYLDVDFVHGKCELGLFFPTRGCPLLLAHSIHINDSTDPEDQLENQLIMIKAFKNANSDSETRVKNSIYKLTSIISDLMGDSLMSRIPLVPSSTLDMIECKTATTHIINLAFSDNPSFETQALQVSFSSKSSVLNTLSIQHADDDDPGYEQTLSAFAHLVTCKDLGKSTGLQHIVSTGFPFFKDDIHTELEYSEDHDLVLKTFNPWPFQPSEPGYTDEPNFTFIDPLAPGMEYFVPSGDCEALLNLCAYYKASKDILSIQLCESRVSTTSAYHHPLIVFCSHTRLIRYQQQGLVMLTYAFKRATKGSKIQDSLYALLQGIHELAMGDLILPPHQFTTPIRKNGNIEVFSASKITEEIGTDFWLPTALSPEHRKLIWKWIRDPMPWTQTRLMDLVSTTTSSSFSLLGKRRRQQAESASFTGAEVIDLTNSQ